MVAPDAPEVVKSDETLISIIEVLHDRGEAGITEIAERTDVAKSTVYKHLKTLEKHGYVVHDGNYGVSLRFLTVGGALRDHNEFYRAAISTVEELSKKTDKMISFIVRENEQGVFIYSSNDKYGLRKMAPLGDRFPIHQDAAGKAILAELPDEEIARICQSTGLPGATENTITEQDELFEEIRDVQTRGYATSDEERVRGFRSVSATVHPETESTIGAISLASPSDIPSEKIHTDYADWVTEAANELQVQLQYQ